MVSFATFVRRKSPLPDLCYFYLISRYAVYTIYKSTQTAPSHLDIVFLVFANTNKITALINRMIQSVRDSPNTLSGEIVADIPRIKRILKIFDPIAFPRARPLSPFRVATIEVTSSGREVPIATMVRPIKFWLTPNDTAIWLALFTTRLPPKITATSPPAIKIRDLYKGMLFSSGQLLLVFKAEKIIFTM